MKKAILYGGDYYPEQWPKALREEDMRLFKLAELNLATVAVFAWSKLQPGKERYNFEWLDEVLATLHDNGMAVCLATATAAVPAWLARRYPEVLRVDLEGRRHRFGQRHNFCPNSPVYRHLSRNLAERLAERYATHPALVLWHVNNEYGGVCYCENCERAFRRWLEARYGTLEALNEAWNTAYWSHIFYGWEEIVVPNKLSEHLSERETAFPGISLDYARFNSESLLACFRNEKEVLKKYTPEVPVTTNLMGSYKPLDYFRWGRELDVVSWDNYPAFDTPDSTVALHHDLMRGVGAQKPFLLMEQTPSQQNWQPYNSLKRPGVMRLQSYQAIAHGADGVMFFQLRRSRGGCEKFHGAVIEHAGHEHTRVFREVAALGRELKNLGDTFLGARLPAKAAILFDWDNWWALEYSSGPSRELRYLDEVQKYYDAFYQQRLPLDVIGTESPLRGYRLLVAPLLYLLKPGYAAKLEAFVKGGGTLITTFFSGIVDEHDLVTLGGYPGELRALLGIWAEEIDALPPGHTNRLEMCRALGELQGSYRCGLLCDLIHSEGAEVLASYGEDFYQGRPALTRNAFGQGEAWYVASSPEPAFLQGLVAYLCAEQGITSLVEAPSEVEATLRVMDSARYLFVLNHSDGEVQASLPFGGLDLLSGRPVTTQLTLSPYGVAIVREMA